MSLIASNRSRSTAAGEYTHTMSLLQSLFQMTGQMPAMIVSPPPDYPGPHDFLILALVTTILCSFINIISLAFGIPAVILAAMVKLL